MKKPILLAAFLAAGGLAKTQVIPNFDWVRNYSEQNSRENVPSAIDGEDNVIVCGYTTISNDDVLVLKYDPNGNLLWTYQYDNGGNDRANAVITDGAGNIYIAGQSQGTGTALDYVTIKLNASGVQQWASRYNGPTNQGDAALSVAIDSSGNVYVTGGSKSTTGIDYATLKYNSSGTQQWAYRYDGPSSGDDRGSIIKWDTLGNLYVTGRALSSSGYDIITLKINPSTGANIWTHTANGSANLDDTPYDMLIDNGHPVIAGMLNNSTTGEDYYVQKINGSTGATSWTYNHDGYGQNDLASALAMTTDGYFYVTGIAITSGSAIEYHTIKLSNSGSAQWINTEATGMSSPADGNPKLVRDFVDHMYVTGQKMEASKDIYVYQVTPGGNKTWDKTHDGSAHNTDVGVDFLVNSLGQLYMVGQTYNLGAKWDFTTIKISQTPVVFPPDIDSERVGNLKFYPNLGQLYNTGDSLATDVEYYNNIVYPNTYISKNKLSYVLYRIDSSNTTNDTVQRIDMSLAQTNGLTEIYQFEQNPTKYNYFFGNLTDGITNVKNANRLLIPNIYPGIDLHYYSSGKGLKMYWVIKPWASPGDIQLDFSGQSSIALSSGQLHINSLLECIVWDNPQFYQVDTAFTTSPAGYVLLPVSSGAYTLTGSTVSFNTPTYNPLLPLIIQVDNGDAPPPPASSPDGNLYWTTYVGYGATDMYKDMQTDANEDLLVCGTSTSLYFPTTPGAIVSSNFSGNEKGIFSKYSHSNGQMLFSTYIGATSSSYVVFPRAIDGDADGKIYVTGQCSGAAFTGLLPNLTGGNYQKTTPSGSGEMFLLRFDPDSLTPQMEYFTYFGGTGSDNPMFMRVDRTVGNERICIGGGTGSTDFTLTAPTVGYHRSTSSKGFITEFSLTGDTLYSSYFPGFVRTLIPEQPGSILYAGDLFPSDTVGFPLANPGFSGTYYDASHNGGNDIFLTKLSGSAHYVAYSTYMGGSGDDMVYKLTKRDTVYALVGATYSTDFKPMKNSPGGYIDSFVLASPYNSDLLVMRFGLGTQLRHSTLFGGNFDSDFAYCAAFDRFYNLYVSGATASNDGSFDLIDYPGNYFSYPSGNYNSYIFGMRYDNVPFWVTNFGGDWGAPTAGGTDQINGMVITSDDRLFIAGETTSDIFLPLRSWIEGVSYYDSTYNNAGDCLMGMFYLSDMPNGIFEPDGGFPYNNLISVYPNPNDGTFSLVLSDDLEKASISVYNNIGELVYREKPGYLTSKVPHPLTLRNLSTGMYYLYVNSLKGIQTAKFIVR